MKTLSPPYLLLPVLHAFLLLLLFPNQSLSLAVGDTEPMECTLDHWSYCQTSAYATVWTDKNSPGITASFRTGLYANQCGSVSVNVSVDGTLVYTSPLLSPKSSLKDVPLGTFPAGKHDVVISEASSNGSSCPEPPNNALYSYYLYTELNPSKADTEKRTFKIGNDSAVEIGERISFEGKGWKSKGKPIKVYWGKELIKTFPASRSFRGAFRLADFPQKTTTACNGSLIAKQGSVSEIIALTGGPDKYVYYASGLKKPDGKALKGGTIVCGGAGPKKLKNYSWVYKSTLTDTEKPGVVIDDAAGQVQASAVFFGPTGAIKLSRGSSAATATISLNPTIGASRTDLSPFNPEGRPGVVTITDLVLSNPAEFDIHYYSDHDLQINGKVTLTNGYLFVSGNLTINGAVSGTGAIVATGNLTINGALNLVPVPGLDGSTTNGITLLGGADLLLGK